MQQGQGSCTAGPRFSYSLQSALCSLSPCLCDYTKNTQQTQQACNVDRYPTRIKRCVKHVGCIHGVGSQDCVRKASRHLEIFNRKACLLQLDCLQLVRVPPSRAMLCTACINRPQFGKAHLLQRHTKFGRPDRLQGCSAGLLGGPGWLLLPLHGASCKRHARQLRERQTRGKTLPVICTAFSGPGGRQGSALHAPFALLEGRATRLNAPGLISNNCCERAPPAVVEASAGRPLRA